MKKDYADGNRDAEPNIIAYNAVLNAAEYTRGSNADREEAFKVACVVFDELRNSQRVAPDHVTYGTYMGVIDNLMPKSGLRDDMIQLVFRRCCADGMLGPVVMKKFQEAASPTQFLELMGRVSVDSIPPAWTCNVLDRRGI